jgi:hypothetical protein
MTRRIEIGEYLAGDEVVEKEFSLGDRFVFGVYKVYATNKRLFIARGDSIKDIDYSHIASIELKEEGSLPAVAIGALFWIAGLVVLFRGFHEWWTWALIGLGVVVFILGLVIRRQCIKLAIAGVAYAERLSGYRSELDALFRIVREKRSMEK